MIASSTASQKYWCPVLFKSLDFTSGACLSITGLVSQLLSILWTLALPVRAAVSTWGFCHNDPKGFSFTLNSNLPNNLLLVMKEYLDIRTKKAWYMLWQCLLAGLNTAGVLFRVGVHWAVLILKRFRMGNGECWYSSTFRFLPPWGSSHCEPSVQN